MRPMLMSKTYLGRLQKSNGQCKFLTKQTEVKVKCVTKVDVEVRKIQTILENPDWCG